MHIKSITKSRGLAVVSATGIVGLSLVGNLAFAATPPLVASSKPVAITAPPFTAVLIDNTQQIATLQKNGDAEIARRVARLDELGTAITGAKHLTGPDQAYLSNEVAGEISGLTALKTQLDGETTLSAAQADVANITSEFRVYLVVVPKVQMVRAADDQQNVEANLTSLAAKLQSRINAKQTAGNDVTALQSQLNDMNAQIASANAISTSMEADVLPLQPSDYNTNHNVLSGDLGQLKTAHSDNVTASADANKIVSELKSL